MPVLDVQCSRCGQQLKHWSGSLWHGESDIAPQYCWIDPKFGSQLHEPVLHLERSTEFVNSV